MSLLTFFLLLILSACGGSSTQDATVELLPNGPNDPRAYTEQFLDTHPGAVLRPGLIAILSLEPADGVETVTYQLDAATELDLSIAPDAGQIGALILRDGQGRQEARVVAGTTRVSLAAGRHTLEIHHVDAGNAAAPTQVVFVRVGTGVGATMQASANCVACNFNMASLVSQTFDGLDLSNSTFESADVEQSSFVGTNLNGTDWTEALLRNDVFTDASLQQAELGSDAAIPTSIFSCDFRGADLTGAHFDQADINDVIFGDTDPSRAANLSSTTWQTLLDPCFITQVALADFRNVNLSGARFLGTQISGSDFSGASLNGANFTGGPGTCTRADLVVPMVTVCDADCTFGTEPTSGRKTDFSNAILASTSAPSLQLQGQKLSGVLLEKAQLTDGAFDGYDLTSSDLTAANLVGVQLDGANLQGTTLAGANLAGAQLNSTNLQTATLTDANLIGAQLNNADLRTATLTGAMLSNVQLNGATLDGVNLEGLNMQSAQLNRASLYEVNLQDAILDDATMVGARFNLASLKGASLKGVLAGVQPGTSGQITEFEGAYMVNVDLTDADLRGADFSNAHLYGTSKLERTLLDSAVFSKAICAGTTFSGSFNDTVFTGAVLVNATFNGANLTDAKFDSAYLQGTNFSAASTVLSATLSNSQVSTEAGTWTFTEQNGITFEFEYAATELGAFATDPTVTCPNGADGPCTPSTLTPVDNGPFPPIPPCVPSYKFCDENCFDPPVYDVNPPHCG